MYFNISGLIFSLVYFSIKIWSFNGYKVIRSIEHSAKITALIFSKDSNFMITGSEDNNCKIWELSTGKLIQVYF